MDIIINTFKSLVKLNHWDIERFDIQSYSHLNGTITGYVGYVSIKGFKNDLIIRKDGSFEFSDI